MGSSCSAALCVAVSRETANPVTDEAANPDMSASIESTDTEDSFFSTMSSGSCEEDLQSPVPAFDRIDSLPQFGERSRTEEEPSIAVTDHEPRLQQFGLPVGNPLVVPSLQPRQQSPRPSNFSSSHDSSASMLGDEVPRNLRRFLSTTELEHSRRTIDSDRTNIYVPGDVPDLTMIPVASAVAYYTDSELESANSNSGQKDSLPTPNSPSRLSSCSVPILRSPC